MEKRLKKHNGNSGGFTKKKGPWILVYKEEFNDKKSAWLREQQIKRYKGGNSFKRLIKLWKGGRAV